MPWRIVERQIGRAGGLHQRTARQREWDVRYGEDNWAVGYLIDGEFIPQENALEPVYYKSYEEHFEAHPEDLEELAHTAQRLRNPHAEATTGVDPQVPVILTGTGAGTTPSRPTSRHTWRPGTAGRAWWRRRSHPCSTPRT